MKRIMIIIVVAFILSGCHGNNEAKQTEKVSKDSENTVQEVEDQESDSTETDEGIQNDTHTEDESKGSTSQSTNDSRTVQETKDNYNTKAQSNTQKSSIQINSTSQPSGNEVSDKPADTSGTENSTDNTGGTASEETAPIKKIPIYQTTYWAMCNDEECPSCGYKVTSTVSQEDAISKLNNAGHGNNPACSSYRYGFHEEIIGYK